ncbi:MAG: ATP-dependent zinc metalloprotease FtsH [Gammaproteobacteria bacterium]|nr:ATP-dependent zinc metalloprotease FtsH [Gammaproteobacteria bacterium]
MEKKTQFNVWYILLAVLGVLMLQNLWVQHRQVESIPYSEFQALLEQGEVEDIQIGEQQIRGKLRHPSEGKTIFVTARVDPTLAKDLAQYDTKFTGVVESHFFANLLSWVLPIIVFFGIWMFLFRRLAEKQGGLGGFMTVGKSKAKVYMERDTKVTFDDVAGVDEAKKELQEVVAFLQHPEKYGRLGARMPKGILLVGPPGTGKTLFARAVAGEAKVPFFSINGSEFVEMFVGVGAARVRDLFEQARQKAPCIIFIDELDALGRARGAFPAGGGHDEKEQTLNQLLAELDGFDPGLGVVLLAATNRPEILDPALLRPGRFDRHVLVERPDRTGRVAILKVHIKGVTLGSDVDIDAVAAITPGFSGADLANLVNEAAVLATRRDAQSVEMEDFNNAIERIVAGLEKKNRLLNPHEREVVAYHETGHALVALALPGTDPVHKISIIPRGIGALGYTIQRPIEDRYLMTRNELENKLAVLFGGRAAEILVFDELSTGAADDLAKATNIARSMVTRYGMEDRVGQMTYEDQPHSFLGTPYGTLPERREYSEETAREIDCAVREIVTSAFDRATEILTRHRKILEKTAKQLLDKETLTADELPDLRSPKKKAATSA